MTPACMHVHMHACSTRGLTCGRTHRSNQLHGPEYVLCMTDMGGERRFASTVAKRLQALGALTKGDRRAGDASNLSDYDVDTKLGKVALTKLLNGVMGPTAATTPPPESVRAALDLRRDALRDEWAAYQEEATDALCAAGVLLSKTSKQQTSVKTFLNRLLGMRVRMQKRIFGHFTALLDDEVRTAKQEGVYDDGVVDISGQCTVERGYPKVGAEHRPSSPSFSASSSTTPLPNMAGARQGRAHGR